MAGRVRATSNAADKGLDKGTDKGDEKQAHVDAGYYSAGSVKMFKTVRLQDIG